MYIASALTPVTEEPINHRGPMGIELYIQTEATSPAASCRFQHKFSLTKLQNSNWSTRFYEITTQIECRPINHTSTTLIHKKLPSSQYRFSCPNTAPRNIFQKWNVPTHVFFLISKEIPDVIRHKDMFWTNVNHDYCITASLQYNELTSKHWETHKCVVSTVATDALVLKHQAISIHNAD